MQIFAHRGASRVHTENTLEAFEAALATEATGIETDLRLTADGVIALVHDVDMWRVAQDPRAVASLTWAELARLDLNGARIARLEDLWSLAAGRVRLNLEIKAGEVVPPLARFLAARSADVLVTTGDTAILDAVVDALPTTPRGMVADRFPKVLATRARGVPFHAVSLRAGACRPDHIAEAHRVGVELFLWTVDVPDDAVRWHRAGVDGLFTNTPETLTPVLRRIPPKP